MFSKMFAAQLEGFLDELWSLDQKHILVQVHLVGGWEHCPEYFIKTSCFILLSLIKKYNN